MAQTLLSSKPGVTNLCIETAFGAGGTGIRILPVEDSVELDLQQDELPNETEQPSLLETPDPLRGLKSSGSSVKFRHYLRPGPQLTGVVTPATPPSMIAVKACFGGESISYNSGGTTVAAAATTTSVPVVSATGLAKGQVVLIGVAGFLEPTTITNVASNTLTVSPALSAVPASGQLVVGMYNYFLTESNSQSLFLDRSLTGDPNLQWRCYGGIPKLSFTWERGKILEYAADIKFANWSGPLAFGIPTTPAADTMGAPFVMRDGITLLQAPGTTTRVHYSLRSLKFEVADSLEHTPELVGSTEGVVGVTRIGARPVGKITVRFTSDTARSTDWFNQTKLRLFAAVSASSALAKRWCVLDAPNCVPVGNPKFMSDGGQMVTEMVLHAKLSTLTGNPTFTPGTTDLAYSPIVIAVG